MLRKSYIDDLYKKNAKAINEAISRSTLKQVEIAKAIGVTPQSVTKWIRTGKISRCNLVSLGKVLQANFDSLIRAMTMRQIEGLKHKKLHLEVEKLDAEQAKEVSKFIKGLSLQGR